MIKNFFVLFLIVNLKIYCNINPSQFSMYLGTHNHNHPQNTIQQNQNNSKHIQESITKFIDTICKKTYTYRWFLAISIGIYQLFTMYKKNLHQCELIEKSKLYLFLEYTDLKTLHTIISDNRRLETFCSRILNDSSPISYDSLNECYLYLDHINSIISMQSSFLKYCGFRLYQKNKQLITIKKKLLLLISKIQSGVLL